jgi:hypothetical protein
MTLKRTVALMLLFISIGAISVKSSAIDNLSQEKTSPKIVRQTKEQAKDSVLKSLMSTEPVIQEPPKRDPQDTSVFGKPITALLPLDKIESIFVPHPSFATNRTSGEGLSDDEILALLNHSRLTSEAEMYTFHLAPWITLYLTLVNKEQIRLRLMLGGSMGFVVLPDGQVYGFIWSKSVAR